MELQDLATGARPIPIAEIGGDIQLATQVQSRLGAVGLLDPPTDGRFGPVSHWALGEFLRAIQASPKELGREAARALVETRNETDIWPMSKGPESGGTFAERIVRAMVASGYWVARHPRCVNIVYVEGCGLDGQKNENLPNEFNDSRLLLRVNRNGRPVLEGAWEATTEPGYFYTRVKRLEPTGAARIAFGQYKAWAVGRHPLNGAAAHEALVQVSDVKIHRDLNEDFKRMGDRTFVGVFCINQHWGYDSPRSDIGKTSAGCLVGRTRSGHREFMAIVKDDERFRASNAYRFLTTVFDALAV